jgi:hypothetical protein
VKDDDDDDDGDDDDDDGDDDDDDDQQCAETEPPEQWQDKQVPTVPLQPEDFPPDSTVDQHVRHSTGHSVGECYVIKLQR